MHSKLPKVGKRISGSQREHQISPAYVLKAGTGDGNGTEDGKEYKGRSQGGMADRQEAEDEGDGW